MVGNKFIKLLLLSILCISVILSSEAVYSIYIKEKVSEQKEIVRQVLTTSYSLKPQETEVKIKDIEAFIKEQSSNSNPEEDEDAA